MEKEKLQEIAFNIIASVGQARSIILTAMKNQSDGLIKKEQLIDELNEAASVLQEAGKQHLEVIQHEAQNKDLPFTMLLVHAEDLYLTTSTMLEMMLRLTEMVKLKNE